MAHPQETGQSALLVQEFTWPDDWDKGAVVGDLLSMYNDKRSQAPRLQYLYVKRHICQLILENVWQNVTWAEGGVQETDSQQSDHIQKLYDALTAEILFLEKRIAANRGGALAAITATAPIMGTTGLLRNPNDRIYRGDPLLRR